MEGDDILLSIVIPTRNRQKYAKIVINTILSYEMENCEVIVQDNSDNEDLKNEINHGLHRTKLTYNYNSQCLSFCQNFEIAVSRAKGTYVCVIGDDDIVLPEIQKAALWAKKNNIDSVISSLKAVYYWPTKILPNCKTGRLILPKYSGKIKKYNVKKEFSQLLDNGGQNYVHLNLPKVYHGLIKREILTKVKLKRDKIFGGLSPDIYASALLSQFVSDVYMVNYPLTLSGICEKSGSADSATGKHTGQLSEAPHFRGNLDHPWSEKVPKFYSVETIWADSLLHALKDTESDDQSNKFNVAKLSAYSIYNNKQYRDLVVKFYLEYNNTFRLNSIFSLVKAYFKGPVFHYSIQKRIERLFLGKVVKVENLNSIEDAVGIIYQKKSFVKTVNWVNPVKI